MKSFKIIMLAVAVLVLAAPFARAEDAAYTLTIKNHKFTPDTLEIPAGQKVKITIDNQDPTAEEFESEKLDREKVIQGNSKGVVVLGPLAAGTYPFVGEFNQATAKGQIVVK